MSGEIPNLLNSAKELPQGNKPKLSPGPITMHDLISFKEDLLKELRLYKSKTTTNINNEFEKYLALIEKNNNKMNFIEREKSTFVQKPDYIQDKNNIFLEISNKHTELKKQIMVEDVQITTIKKDLEEIVYKYDKTIIDNLQIPGLVGNSCRFPNLKEYILSNKDEMTNAIMANKQISMEFKSFKKKTEITLNQINEKVKSQEYRYSNLLNTKFNELKDKFDGLYEALNEKINNLTMQVNVEAIDKNKEIENIKKLIFDNKKKMIEKNEMIKEEFFVEIDDIKKRFHKIKKNIVNLTNLLAGKSNGLNKQMVIKNFNHMMKNLYKDFDKINLENSEGNETINENKPEPSININNNKKHFQNKLLLGKSLFSKAPKAIKPSASSSIKDYIEGKISAIDANKKKQSIKLNKKNILEFNRGTNKDLLSKNIINIFNNQKIMPRMSLATNNNFNLMKDIRSSFSENKKNSEKEIYKKRSSVKLILEKKSSKTLLKNLDININENNNNINSKNTIKNNDEIINEEDSNKHNSTDSSRINEKNDKMKTRNSKYNNSIKTDFVRKNNNKKIDDNSSYITSSSKTESIDNSKSIYNNINNTINNTNNINNTIDNTNNEIENQNLNTSSNNTNYQNNKIKSFNDNKINYNQGINNYYEKTVNNIIQNTNFSICKEINKINNDVNKTNLSANEKIEQRERSLNKIKQNSNISLKKNININSLTNRINNNNNKYNILTLNNNNTNINYNPKKKNEMVQISPSSIDKVNKGMLQTVNTNFRKNNSPFNTKNNFDSKYLNYISKTIVFQNQDLMIKTTRNKGSNNNIKINQEKDIAFSSYDGQKNKIDFINNEMKGYKSDKKDIDAKNKYDNKNEKDIYLDNDVFKKIRFIKDEKIIDKPLLLDGDIFKISQNKGSLENKIIELEYFTKKKFDELVKEIKTFIPIHFNSHLKDYSFKKQNDNIYII